MALFIKKNSDNHVITYEEYLDYLNKEVDFDNKKSIIQSSYMMQALSRNKKWFFELINNYLLKKNYSFYDDAYPSTSFIVKNDDPRYTLRINLWFPDSNEYSKQTKELLFAVDFPHDHNFDLLTTGLYGEGYTSEFYSYNECNDNFPLNHKVKIKKMDTLQLHEGTSIFMDANKDIHTQTLPKTISASFNLLVTRTSTCQYLFEIKEDVAIVKRRIETRKTAKENNIFNLISLSNRLNYS